MPKRASGRRELVDTGRNKMYGRRDEQGRCTEMDDVSRSLSTDQRRNAKTKTSRDQEDRGDR